jgi:hypothetical protein
MTTKVRRKYRRVRSFLAEYLVYYNSPKVYTKPTPQQPK